MGLQPQELKACRQGPAKSYTAIIQVGLLPLDLQWPECNAGTLNFPIHRSANWDHFRVTAQISHLNNDPTGFICDFCLSNNIFILVMF